MGDHNRTLHLLGILCNAAHAPGGDRINLFVGGCQVWSSPTDLLFHPHYVYYANFEDGTVHMNGHVGSLPDYSPDKFCFQFAYYPLVIELEICAYGNCHQHLGRFKIWPDEPKLQDNQQRIIGHGAHYGIIYRLSSK